VEKEGLKKAGFRTTDTLMKSAYELAMERLNKTAPVVKLTDEQKKQIADLESQCMAKIAERELLVKGEIAKAIDKGDGEAIEQLEKQLVSDRKSLRADFDAKKEKVRQQTTK
jgi:hypothetical protein